MSKTQATMKYNTHEQDLGYNKIQYQLFVLKQPLHADRIFILYNNMAIEEGKQIIMNDWRWYWMAYS